MTSSNTGGIDVVVDHTKSKFGVPQRCGVVMVLITPGNIDLNEAYIIIRGCTSMFYGYIALRKSGFPVFPILPSQATQHYSIKLAKSIT